jgi:hypothetical protein
VTQCLRCRPAASHTTHPPAFEGPYSSWQTSGNSCSCAKRAPATRCVASIHSYGGGDEASLRVIIAGARARGYSMTYISSVTAPNPYRQLPPFWETEISAACASPLKP